VTRIGLEVGDLHPGRVGVAVAVVVVVVVVVVSPIGAGGKRLCLGRLEIKC